jgi:hypothetical protein
MVSRSPELNRDLSAKIRKMIASPLVSSYSLFKSLCYSEFKQLNHCVGPIAAGGAKN